MCMQGALLAMNAFGVLVVTEVVYELRPNFECVVLALRQAVY